jgi:uncharacterized protein (DUF1330 family)
MAFIVVEANVRDIEARDRYGELAGPVLRAHGGRTVAFGRWEPLFGESGYRMGMIIEFDTVIAARNWHGSPEYQALVSLRSEGLDCRFRLLG